MNMPEIIKIDIGFASLVVEVFNSDYPVPEICISIQDDNNMQDIACVRQVFDLHNKSELKESIEVLVYSDRDDEDYTHKFTIERHSEWEE